ncbi:hypothetical protein FHQ25_12625, partial [Testudinibacter sp. TR-2022]|uniref:hypothetical protein n=1 Tax=Testudinibacter sp. TR-2022 TaxID=2585029 RepID=UPI0011711451
MREILSIKETYARKYIRVDELKDILIRYYIDSDKLYSFCSPFECADVILYKLKDYEEANGVLK